MNLKSRSKVTTEFSMSSMTDLIFLLLIFFIITSTMVNPNAIKLLLPKGETQTTITKPVEVSISEDLRVYVENKETSYDNLPAALTKEVNARYANNQEVTLSLSADKSVPVEYLVKVMTVAQNMKLKMIIRTGRE